MIWLLALLVIFWKPLYYSIRCAIAAKNKDVINQSYYFSQIRSWFKLLWVLVKPEGTKDASQKPEQSPQSNA